MDFFFNIINLSRKVHAYFTETHRFSTRNNVDRPNFVPRRSFEERHRSSIHASSETVPTVPDCVSPPPPLCQRGHSSQKCNARTRSMLRSETRLRKVGGGRARGFERGFSTRCLEGGRWREWGVLVTVPGNRGGEEEASWPASKVGTFEESLINTTIVC